MSKNEIKKANNVVKGIIIGMAAVLAVVAFVYNPGHLFTAGLVFAFGLECEPFNEEDYDIC